MTIIRAQATEEQAEHFCQLAQMASDDLFTLLFGARDRAVLRAMFQRTGNEYTYAHAHFLVVQGGIAGLLHAYPASETKPESWRSLWLMMRHARLQAFRLLASAIVLRDILGFIGEGLDAGDHYIAMLAIYPQFRGRGYSKKLLAKAEELALEHNCSRLALDVDERNTVARAAYQRTGFKQIGESKQVQIAGECLRVLRLAKPLTRHG